MKYFIKINNTNVFVNGPTHWLTIDGHLTAFHDQMKLYQKSRYGHEELVIFE